MILQYKFCKNAFNNYDLHAVNYSVVCGLDPFCSPILFHLFQDYIYDIIF